MLTVSKYHCFSFLTVLHYPVFYTLCSIPCVLCPVFYALCSIYPVFYTLCFMPCVLYPVFYIPCVLYPVFYNFITYAYKIIYILNYLAFPSFDI